MYHTQEKRNVRLVSPVKCTRRDAWLGHGFYFWDEYEDAIIWGKCSKNRTGRYEIYKSTIASENFLNTVFDEEDYKFYRKQIEKIEKFIIQKTGIKATVEDVCDYLNTRTKWSENLDGILFQDSPNGYNNSIVGYPYRKRIQAVVYNTNCIKDFSFHEEFKI